MRWVMIWAALTGSAMADGERAGSFDYYVMALSWSPSFCATTGDAKEREQCAPGQHRGWVLHGLWPQYERGWPANCATTEPGPSRRQTEAMADIMGSSGLAWYQWKKHGRCSGLSAQAYFARARDAYESVAQPEVLQRLDRPVKLPASVIEEAWIAEDAIAWKGEEGAAGRARTVRPGGRHVCSC